MPADDVADWRVIRGDGLFEQAVEEHPDVL
jgi:hypothetical protein